MKRSRWPRVFVALAVAVLVAPLFPSASRADVVRAAAERAAVDVRERLEDWLASQDASEAPSLDEQWDALQAAAVAAGDPDSDSDGLADSVEAVLGLAATRRDTDRDTLEDVVELWLGLDPRKADTNADGLPDNAELQGGGLAKVLEGIGGSASAAYAVNGVGRVAGGRTTVAGLPEAWLWSADGVAVLPAAVGTVAAVNDMSQVVGMTVTGDAYVWSAAGGLVPLGLANGYAAGVNESGVVVGGGIASEGDLPEAWRWESGTLTWLGMLAGGETSAARAVNEAGQVVGVSGAADGYVHAVLWDGDAVTDLGTLGGLTSEANSINDAGQIVGKSETAGGEFHAVLWDGGVPADLGTLGGTYSDALAINSSGQIVGESETADGESHAFLWDGGGMIDLGVVGGSWSVARWINDAGLIVGSSETAEGSPRASVFGQAAVDAASVANALANDDNDGDGVPDGVDLSPFSASEPFDDLDIRLTTTGQPTYLDVQVVPEDVDGTADRLRLPNAMLDWMSGDQAGAMQDLATDSSIEDVVITPYLELSLDDRSVISDPGYLAPRARDAFARPGSWLPPNGLGNADTGQAWGVLGWWWTDGVSGRARAAWAGPAIATVDLGATDGYVQARLAPNTMESRGEGLVFRLRDAANFEYVLAKPSGVEVHAVTAGADSLLVAWDLPWSWDRTLRVEHVGTSVRVYWTTEVAYETAWTYVGEVEDAGWAADATRGGLYLPVGCEEPYAHLSDYCNAYGLGPYGAWSGFEAGVLTTALDDYGLVFPDQSLDGLPGDPVGVTYTDVDGDGAADDLTLYTSRQGFLGADAIVAGAGHTCAIADGGLWCWGDNRDGQLGTGAPGPYRAQVGDSVHSGDVIEERLSGRFPTGLSWPALEPYPVGKDEGEFTALRSTAAAAAVSDDHTCAVAGTPPVVYCWGDRSTEPMARVGGTTGPVVAVIGGDDFTCAVDRPVSSGPYRLLCRGDNASGQLGQGTTTDASAWQVVDEMDAWTLVSGAWVLGRQPFVLDPTVASPAGSVGVSLAAGGAHACAVVNLSWSPSAPGNYPPSGRRIACWGENAGNQVTATGATTDVTVPRELALGVVGPVEHVAAFALGAGHTCVLNDWGLSCWGANDHGQAPGFGIDLPLDPLETVTKLTAGDRHTCALTSARRVFCWGDNSSGQVGSGTIGEASLSPTLVAVASTRPLTATDIAAGGNHTCAIADDGGVWCWGENDRGQLGDGTQVNAGRPVAVAPRVDATTGYDLPLDGETTRASRWATWLTEATSWSGNQIPPASYYPDPLPGFDGVVPAGSFVGDIRGDGSADDVLVWGRDPATGGVRYRLGITDYPTYWTSHHWTASELAPMEPGAEGDILGLANVDGQPGLDIVHVAIDDRQQRRMRISAGAGAGEHGTGPLATWSEPILVHGTSQVYVPLTAVRTRTGETVALSARMYLPAGVPAGELDTTARVVWIVRGNTDDPERADAVGRPGARNVPVVLAKYADPGRFRLSGMAATAHDRVEMTVFAPSAADDGARWSTMSQMGIVLEEQWLHGADDGAPTQLWLSCDPARPEQAAGCEEVEDVLALAGLSFESRTDQFGHEDEAIDKAQALAIELLHAVPAGSAVPALFAVERQLRAVSLDDDGIASLVGARVTLDLAAAPAVVAKTFETNYYDTTGDAPAVLEGEVLEWLRGWGFPPEVEERLGALLVAWDIGQTDIVAVDGVPSSRPGSDDATVMRFYDVMKHNAWDGVGAALASLDTLDGLKAVAGASQDVAVVVAETADAARDLALARARSNLADVGAAKIADQVSDIGRGVGKGGAWRAIGKGLSFIDDCGQYLDYATMGLKFLATTLAYGPENRGYEYATRDLAVDIGLLAITMAIEYGAAALAGILVGSGPVGWVGAVAVLVVTAVLLLVDWLADTDWAAWVAERVLPMGDYPAMKLTGSVFNVRSLLDDPGGNGVTAGDAIGLGLDAYTAEFPVGTIHTPWGYSNAHTRLSDTYYTWLSAGMSATTTDALSGTPVVMPAPDNTNHYAPQFPHRFALSTWVVPAGPDTDFAVTYRLDTKGQMGYVTCAPFQGCSHAAKAAESGSVDLATLHYDVLPDTLDGLLGWTAVVTRLDTDGDGIRDAVDADATEPDHDADGVIDGREAQLVVRCDAAPCLPLDTDGDGALDGTADPDSDGDGLSDGAELRLRTRPLAADSDGDGLGDGEELAGWDVSFQFGGQPVTAHVTSDPTRKDSDAGHRVPASAVCDEPTGCKDGLGDAAEKAAGLNPRTSDTDGDGFADAPDLDADGVSDAIEDAAPNGGDGNHDGTDDADQDNVTSIPDAIDGTFLTVEAPAGTTLADVETAVQPAGAPAQLTLPHGVIGFTVDAPSATVKLYFPFDSTLKAYWKYGPTADNAADHWYRFKYEGTTGAEIGEAVVDGTHLTVVTMHLVDGGRGDSDLELNGAIVDPGGLSPWLGAPPVATDDTATTDEDTPVVVSVLANDTDPEDDPIAVTSLEASKTAGAVTLNADGTVTYDPSGAFDRLRPGESASDTFGYGIEDGNEGTDAATVTVEVGGVDDAPAWIATPDSSVQHSDGVAPITVTARDVDSDALTLSAAGLPAGLAIGDASCVPWTTGAECSAQISGTVTAPAGPYEVTLTASHGTLQTASTVTVTVAPEDATVRFHGGNAVAVPVETAGGASGPFELTVRVTETIPDAAPGTAAAGDPGLAAVTMRLVPVGAGAAMTPAGACAARIDGAGYDAELTITCPFDGVPVNTYAAHATVDGGFYAGGGTDVLVVYDPSLGYTTGGGSFTWPDTEDVVSFGYTMEYNRKGESLQGALLLVRHTEAGDYEVRSNSLYGLALGDATASFSGKATYLEPGWPSRVGNHEFTMYVEDNGPEDAGLDRAWIEVRDKVRLPIPAMSLPMPGVDHAVVLDDGDVFAPAKGD